MAVNYSSWNLDRLEKEKDKIEKAIASKQGKQRSQALADVKAVARRAGFAIEDLLAEFGIGSGSDAAPSRARPRGKKKASVRGRTGKVAPKYRNPDDPDTTWSGRGRKPKWVEAHLAKHGNLDAVKIKR